MRSRILGKTNLEVSELSLGGLFVSRYGAQFPQARSAVLRAIELGVNYIDTAPTYSNSEEVLGRILPDIPSSVVLSTKLGGRPQPFRPKDRDDLFRSVERSLKLLGRHHIDLLMIHEPDRPGQYAWWTDPDRYDGPVMDVLAELQQQGIISFIGIAGTTAYELARIARTGRFDVVLTAFNYSLLFREAEHEIFPAAIAGKMGIIVGSPLQQGALSTRYDREVADRPHWMSPHRQAQYQALYAFLDETGIPLPVLGIRFVLSNPDVSCVLMGAASMEQVEQNVEAAEAGPLSSELIARIDRIAAMVPFRPVDEPALPPFGREYVGPFTL